MAGHDHVEPRMARTYLVDVVPAYFVYIDHQGNGLALQRGEQLAQCPVLELDPVLAGEDPGQLHALIEHLPHQLALRRHLSRA